MAEIDYTDDNLNIYLADTEYVQNTEQLMEALTGSAVGIVLSHIAEKLGVDVALNLYGSIPHDRIVNRAHQAAEAQRVRFS
ncbi:hypothetical protein Wildcat_69 [Mycobacterium phage Wildcat]|uniref:Uncharacterized protein n=3 Tax=Mycobacterium virus Wildcat TaxID=1993859 RepID=Q19XZ1_9CAUD|nr:hypothetical protein Wildcat_69 [Mycobacterium phage Wildcat]ABE67674.1 hypothetical protein Wildcat_69 [Mycobacterium phage Wildcat]AJD82142.1 hypothetical protein COSMO_70 [Mycobacterium phage Cosmo]QGJ89957.1 hypothetical protein PBI_MARYV_69 [Mycobacterium phage MaryV]WKR36080.1 hypothetical protein [Mycobacterium phage Azrael100]